MGWRQGEVGDVSHVGSLGWPDAKIEHSQFSIGEDRAP